MNRNLLLLAFLAVHFFLSCKHNPAPNPPAAPAGPEDSTKSSVPDPNDLLKTLQGRWQSEQDSSYTLEFADTQMRHFNGGALSLQSTIEVDGACEISGCKIEGVDTSDGWCFTENTVSKDNKTESQCNFVILCDTAKLQYRALSGTGAGLSFKKIR